MKVGIKSAFTKIPLAKLLPTNGNARKQPLSLKGGSIYIHSVIPRINISLRPPTNFLQYQISSLETLASEIYLPSTNIRFCFD